jgi:type III secretory pathway component EscU
VSEGEPGEQGRERAGPPRVVAKGGGEIGRRIIETARANGIPLEENPALAEALSHVELEQAIPEALYAPPPRCSPSSGRLGKARVGRADTYL